MLKKTLFYILIFSLALVSIWRPAVPAVFEDEQASFLSVEAMPIALLDTTIIAPQEIMVWFVQREEVEVARCLTSYLVTSYERPPPFRLS